MACFQISDDPGYDVTMAVKEIFGDSFEVRGERIWIMNKEARKLR